MSNTSSLLLPLPNIFILSNLHAAHRARTQDPEMESHILTDRASRPVCGSCDCFIKYDAATLWFR